MNFDKYKLSSVSFLIIVLFFISGCSIISHGRMASITYEQVNLIQIGETTKEDIVELFGKPQRIVHKPGEVEAYIYSHGIERSIGVPFFISIGRGGGTGQTLNVIFDKYGVVVDYEYSLDQRGIIK